MRIAGTFNGTGAAVYICLGFIPDWFRYWNIELATPAMIFWSRQMRAAECIEGVYRDQDGGAYADLAKGEGVTPFFAKGKVLTSTDAGTTTYGEGVYLSRDDNDYRYTNTNNPPGDAATVDITTWTLGSSTNFTGNFNGDVTGTYIGEGSEIVIDGRKYVITSLAAGAGGAANEVTLSHSVPSGDVLYIGGMYDYSPMVAGDVARDGILINETTVNGDGNIIFFEAGLYG